MSLVGAIEKTSNKQKTMKINFGHLEVINNENKFYTLVQVMSTNVIKIKHFQKLKN
jgi:hypothetical protein